jgi:hypothetical protein
VTGRKGGELHDNDDDDGDAAAAAAAAADDDDDDDPPPVTFSKSGSFSTSFLLALTMRKLAS